MNIGRAIKLCRVQRNLTQAEVAEAAQISVSYLSLIERGQRDPTFSTLQQIATAVDVPISIIVFLGAGSEELNKISPELAARLSQLSLSLMETPNNANSRVSRAND